MKEQKSQSSEKDDEAARREKALADAFAKGDIEFFRQLGGTTDDIEERSKNVLALSAE